MYCDPAYLTSMPTTLCKMSGWMKKIAGRNINKLRYAGVTPLMEESKEELKSLLVKVKEESERAGLKVSIQKTNTMASGLII